MLRASSLGQLIEIWVREIDAFAAEMKFCGIFQSANDISNQVSKSGD